MLANMREAYTQLMSSFRSPAGAEGATPKGMKSGGDAFDTWDKLDGFPVVTRTFIGSAVTSESTLSSAEEQDVESTIFEPDANFTRQEMFGPPAGR